MATRRFFDGAQIEIGSLPISYGNRIWIKVSGAWTQGMLWIKQSGVWKKSRPFTKVSGAWK
jgi:hypothetical protein